jgi:hypothetical protein
MVAMRVLLYNCRLHFPVFTHRSDVNLDLTHMNTYTTVVYILMVEQLKIEDQKVLYCSKDVIRSDIEF